MKQLKEEVAKETPRFRELLAKVEKLGSGQKDQEQLRHRLDDFKQLLVDTRFALRHIYEKVTCEIAEFKATSLISSFSLLAQKK